MMLKAGELRGERDFSCCAENALVSQCCWEAGEICWCLLPRAEKLKFCPCWALEFLRRIEHGQEDPASQPAVKEGEELLLIAHCRKWLRFSQSSTKL